MATAAGDERGFDEAIVPDGKGGTRRITSSEFVALPLSDRIRLIMEKTVEFRLRGQIVSAREALRR